MSLCFDLLDIYLRCPAVNSYMKSHEHTDTEELSTTVEAENVREKKKHVCLKPIQNLEDSELSDIFCIVGQIKLWFLAVS